VDAVIAWRMPRGWSDRVYSDSGRLPWIAMVDSQNWAAAGDNRPIVAKNRSFRVLLSAKMLPGKWLSPVDCKEH